MIRKLFILASLAATAAAQTGPYSVKQFAPITMTATGQTSAAINFAPQGGSFASGTLTITGVGLTTATVGVLASTDGGVTYVPWNIAPVTALTTLGTTATVTASSVFAINLATVTNLKLVTSGTFTATSITIKLAASPNALLARRRGGACSPLGAWPMNEGTGLLLHDTSGNANNATINTAGAVTWQANAGLPGTTPLWNGTGNALAASASQTSFTGATPFSVSAWVNIPAPLTNQVFLSTLDTAGGTFKGWEMQTGSLGFGFFLINTFPSSAIQVNTSTLAPSALHYLVATYDGSQTAAGVKLYVDGALGTMAIGNDTFTASASNGLPMRVGARNDGTLELSGAMAFAEVYSCVLTPTQVAANNAAGPGIY